MSSATGVVAGDNETLPTFVAQQWTSRCCVCVNVLWCSVQREGAQLQCDAHSASTMDPGSTIASANYHNTACDVVSRLCSAVRKAGVGGGAASHNPQAESTRQIAWGKFNVASCADHHAHPTSACISLCKWLWRYTMSSGRCPMNRAVVSAGSMLHVDSDASRQGFIRRNSYSHTQRSTRATAE